MATSVPILRREINPLREGATAVTAQSDVPIVHPLQARELNFAKNEVQFKRAALQNVYGSHLSMRLQMEESILSNFQRLPTLKSEFVGLSTSLGLDEEIGFSDFLRDPSAPESAIDLHEVMEHRLGL